MLPTTLPIFLLAALSQLASAAPTTPANHDHVLLPRADDQCRDTTPGAGVCSSSDAVACINELAAKGSTACRAGIHTTFCKHGTCQLFGVSEPAASGRDPNYVASSSCADVARGAGRIMDLCSRGDGQVKGYNHAWGNGNLYIEIRHV